MEDLSVDINKLFIDDSKADRNFFALEIDAEKIDSFEHNDLINDWQIEHIRRFNSTARHLVTSLIRVQSSANTLAQGIMMVNKGDLQINVLQEHRDACGDTLLNIDIYIEAIKEFCRYYFFMESKETDNGKSWIKAFDHYKDFSGWKYMEHFLNQCNEIHNVADSLTRPSPAPVECL